MENWRQIGDVVDGLMAGYASPVQPGEDEMRILVTAVMVVFATSAIAQKSKWGENDISPSDPEIPARIVGSALAIDGDTFILTPITGGKDVRIRIWGIDAPEMKIWPWGPLARGVLDRLIVAGGNTVECIPTGKKSYKRIVATCSVKLPRSSAKTDIGDSMIRTGLAVSYRSFSKGRYSSAEAFAQDNALGVWRRLPSVFPSK